MMIFLTLNFTRKVTKSMGDIKWLDEAQSVLHDITPFVKEVLISDSQPDIDVMVFINLKTFEDRKFCIKLCVSGFGIVGSDYDCENIEVVKWFETPYALLSEISNSYVERFKMSLLEKLKNLEET